MSHASSQSSTDSPPSESSSHRSDQSSISDLMDNSRVESNSNLSTGSPNVNSYADISTDLTREIATSQFLDLTNDAYPLDLQESLNGNIDIEIASINRFVDNIESNLVQIGLGSVSTPRVVRARHNNNLDNSNQAIDLIDLSSFDFNPPSPSVRNRVPDAFIDLCTPPRRLPAFIDLADNSEILSSENRSRSNVDNINDQARACGTFTSKGERNDESSHSSGSYRCPVCLENPRKREPSATRCGHVFCKNCIETAVRATKKCPLCNKKMTLKTISRIYI